MTDIKWQTCFQYTKIHNKVTRLPPFFKVTKTADILCNFQYLVMTLLSIRAFIFVGMSDLSFVEGGYIVLAYITSFAKFTIWFLELWQKERPIFFTALLYWSQAVVTTVWFLQGLYGFITDIEKNPYCYPYWTPFYDYSNIIKWIYLFTDVFQNFIFIYGINYFSIWYASMLKFQCCQMNYLKLIIQETFEGNAQQPRERVKWWIKNYQTTLQLTNKMKTLMEPIVMISYLYQLCEMVLSVVALGYGGNTQWYARRVASMIYFLNHLIEFYYECRTADQLVEMNEHILDSASADKIAYKDGKYMTLFYIMTKRQTQKKIRISGLGFFTMSSEQFLSMMYTAFSLYTALVTVINKVKKSQNE